MSMGKRRSVTWDEWDVQDSWMRFYTKQAQRRIKESAKRTTRRRERREAKRECRESDRS